MKIIKPEFVKKMEDQIDQEIWEFAYEEELLPLLKEELSDHRTGQVRKDIHYEFSCPYCNFKSKYFHCICLHMHFTKKCYKSQSVQPCYPMNHCYNKSTKQVFIP